MIDRALELAESFNSSPIRGFTHGRIFRGIMQNLGGGSRGELAARLNISSPTVSKSVRMMIDTGLVREGHLRSTNGMGRPLAPLGLTADFARLGVAVSFRDGLPDRLLGLVRHFDGSIVQGFAEARVRTLHPEERAAPGIFVDTVAAFADELRTDAARVSSAEILGCGISTPGHVNEREGTVRWASRALIDLWNGESELSVAAPLQDRLKVPVVVGNDITSLAVRRNLRPDQPASNYALLAPLDLGVGGALVVNGRTWPGSNGLAGEPGHIPVPSTIFSDCSAPSTLATCQCGGRGHVEAYASPRGIERRAEDLGLAGLPLLELATRPAGEREVADLFLQGGRALGAAIVSILSWFDPQVVVVYLPKDALDQRIPYLAGRYYLEGMQDEIKSSAYLPGAWESVEIRALEPHEFEARLASAASYLVLRRFIRLIQEFDERAAIEAGGLFPWANLA